MLKNKKLFAAAVVAVCALFVVAFAGFASSASKAPAQGAKPAAEALKADPPRDFSDWRLQCATPAKGKKQCEVFQRLTWGKEKDKPQGVALTAMVQNVQAKDKQVTVVHLVTPLGTVLTAGVAIKIDDNKQFKVPYSQCLPGGCLVNMVFDEGTLNKMKSGKLMLVAYRMPNGKDATLKVSLKGFAPAIAAMDQATSKG